MSVTIETLVNCDECAHNCAGDDRSSSASEIRLSRKQAGWQQVGSLDFYEKCVAAGFAGKARQEEKARRKAIREFQL